MFENYAAAVARIQSPHLYYYNFEEGRKTNWKERMIQREKDRRLVEQFGLM